MQRPTLQRLFGPGIMDSLGVRMDEVPTGRAEWPLLTGAVDPAQVKEGTAAADAVTATFSYANLRPKRLSGVYEYTHEMAASVADIEGSLRRDLGDAVKAKMSDRIINGPAPTNANPQFVEGFLTAVTAPGNRGPKRSLLTTRAAMRRMSMVSMPRRKKRYPASLVWTCTHTQLPSIRRAAASPEVRR